ncbi:hypothetical protein [Bdellovibrio sp. HCB274]|uniref:hypothetical protein n=1 Tax=Bdellovibrio sp. HCB274 TaxID=3394361 RepID=UPI0039B39161
MQRSFTKLMCVMIVSLMTCLSLNANAKTTVTIDPDTDVRNVDEISTEKEYQDKVRKDSVKPSASFEGGISGGGGGMVVVTDGMVKLVDLIHPNERFLDRIKSMSQAEYNNFIENSLYPERQAVTKMGKFILYGDLFQGGLQSMVDNHAQFPVFAALAGTRCDNLTVTSFLYLPRIKVRTSDSNVRNFYSERFPKHIQEPAAYYFGNTILLSARMLEKMDSRNIQALGIHECLRNMNDQVLEVGLTTSEIEALTRFYVKMPFPGDEKLLASAKAKSQKLKNVSWIKIAIAWSDAIYKRDQLIKDIMSGKVNVSDPGYEALTDKIAADIKSSRRALNEDWKYQILIEQDCYINLFAHMADNSLKWRKGLSELNQMYISDIIKAHIKLLPAHCK